MAAVLLLPVQANALSARQAVALEPVTGRHLFEREPAARARMASTTKIMTALLICEQCNVSPSTLPVVLPYSVEARQPSPG